MLWNCLTIRKIGSLYHIEWTLNVMHYAQLLLEELLTTLVDFDFDLQEIIFQQDNTSIHTSRIVNEWLWEQPYSVMEWPTRSPNLNPIEHV